MLICLIEHSKKGKKTDRIDNKLYTIVFSAGSDSIAAVNSGRQLESQSSYLSAALTKLSLKSALKTTESPPYKMPPLPLNESSSNAYTDAQIPGMTLINDTQPTVSSVSLRTHSSKFPVR